MALRKNKLYVADTENHRIREIDFNNDTYFNEQGVVCHCHWGRGRTGTMLAAYLVSHSNLPARQAIEHVRQMRPYSVETVRQERVIHSFAEYLRRRRSGADSHSLKEFMRNEDAQNGADGKAPELTDDDFIFYWVYIVLIGR